MWHHTEQLPRVHTGVETVVQRHGSGQLFTGSRCALEGRATASEQVRVSAGLLHCAAAQQPPHPALTCTGLPRGGRSQLSLRCMWWGARSDKSKRERSSAQASTVCWQHLINS